MEAEIRSVGVVGGGVMGAGIAEVCARHDLEVQLVEASDELAQAGRGRVEASLARGLERGKLTETERDLARGRIVYGSDLQSVHRSDLVIEAVPERLELKRDLFARLDRIVPAHAVLATNTSALPVIDIARATARPERVVGTHFFNPPPVMQLLELVRSIATDEETLQVARGFGAQIGKHVIVAQDRGGFIVNLLLVPYLNSAVRLYESGFASREDIDAGMRLGCNHPMGPLELLDHIGLDIALMVCAALHEEYALPEYAAPPLLRRMVAAGHLGRKTGRGFYDYTTDAAAR